MGKDHSYVRLSTDDGEGLGFLRSRELGSPRQSGRDGEHRGVRRGKEEGGGEMMRNREAEVAGGVRKQREMWAERDMGKQGRRCDSQRDIHGGIKRYGETER